MIREYLQTDSAELIRLLRLNVPEAFHPEEEKDFIRYLQDEVEDYFVFEENETILGCGGLNYPDEDIGIISWDIIHPNYHGRGIGRQLMDFRLDLLERNKVDLAIVRTSQHAFRFYEKFGFKLETVEKDGWAPGFDIYVMKRQSFS